MPPRFEDLMDRQGRIRLQGDGTWLVELCFDTNLRTVVDMNMNTMRVLVSAEEYHGTADFDAMLAALEPYELVDEIDPADIRARIALAMFFSRTDEAMRAPIEADTPLEVPRRAD